MRITEIKILPVEGNEKLKAYVTVKVDDCFVIRDMKVIAGSAGNFVAMPAKKMKDGSYRDLVHPVDRLTREMFEGEIMKEFNRVMSLRPDLRPEKDGRAAGDVRVDAHASSAV